MWETFKMTTSMAMDNFTRPKSAGLKATGLTAIF
jgi:hypothetical protein